MTLGAGKKSIRITANADEYDFVRKRAGRFGKTSESAKSLFSLGSLLVKSGFNESVLEREDRDRIIGAQNVPNRRVQASLTQVQPCFP